MQQGTSRGKQGQCLEPWERLAEDLVYFFFLDIVHCPCVCNVRARACKPDEDAHLAVYIQPLSLRYQKHLTWSYVFSYAFVCILRYRLRLVTASKIEGNLR